MARRRRRKPRQEFKPSAPNDSVKVWRPGVDPIDDGEVLEYDPSTYNCLHAFSLGWPCLSFDILRDDEGALRGEFPHTMFCVAGTQAEAGQVNKLIVVKLSQVPGKKRNPHGSASSSSDETDESDDSDTDNEELASRCKLQVRSIAHSGSVNRVRAMPQEPNIVAAWSEAGYVQIWDVKQQLQSLSSGNEDPCATLQAPLKVFNHKAEGFALDWSTRSPRWLASGDNLGVIHLWQPESGNRWQVGGATLTGHLSSVEDIQWSPESEHQISSCSSDGMLVLWDIRTLTATDSIRAHDADVNVLSWNRLEPAMLATGGDDGVVKLWNKNRLQEGVMGIFKYHTAPITSLEWSPHSSTMLAVTSADNRLSIWDFSLEADSEEEVQQGAEAPQGLPPQLMFVHQGQEDMKEVHWHPQIPGLLVSTALDGFNVFQPCNVI